MKSFPTDQTSVLQTVYGYSSFRPGQSEIVSSVCAGEDVLALLPTGGGKSVCYQVPALARPGCAVVISPLISLMKDQVDTLLQLGVPATYINSSQSRDTVEGIMRAALRNEYKLIYIAPERLQAPSFISFLSRLQLSFVSVDEAHCVSQWGHDFRPSYVKIADALSEIEANIGKRIQRVALTATATLDVKKDIVSLLKMRNPSEYVNSFDRPNLRFLVRHSRSKLDDINKELAMRRGQSVVVYCGSRRNVESVTRSLRAGGHNAAAYHAGLMSDERARVQDDFLYDRTNVIVSTNAFGMGIDKSDVRLVIHYDMPGSLEAYYQEAGRAGRDGDPAECILLFNSADRRLQEFLIESTYPTQESVSAVRDFLVAWPDPVVELTNGEICDMVGPAKPHTIDSILLLLQSHGIIYPYRDPSATDDGSYLNAWSVEDPFTLPDASGLEVRRQVAERSLGIMEGFCLTRKCRRHVILKYFGDPSPALSCGNCDVCLTAAESHGGNGVHDAVRTIVSAIKLVGVRYGSLTVAKVLLGTRDPLIMRNELDRSNVFGSLKQWSRAQVEKALDYLVSESVIAKSADGPGFHILERGERVFSGLECIELHASVETRSSRRTSVDQSSGRTLKKPSDSLYEALVALRSRLSESENVPPFMILGNRTMREIVAAKPKTTNDLLGIQGLGVEKVRRFGDDLLKVVREEAA